MYVKKKKEGERGGTRNKEQGTWRAHPRLQRQMPCALLITGPSTSAFSERWKPCDVCPQLYNLSSLKATYITINRELLIDIPSLTNTYIILNDADNKP